MTTQIIGPWSNPPKLEIPVTADPVEEIITFSFRTEEDATTFKTEAALVKEEASSNLLSGRLPTTKALMLFFQEAKDKVVIDEEIPEGYFRAKTTQQTHWHEYSFDLNETFEH